MSSFDRKAVAGSTTAREVVDQGLRSYMLKIYNYMALGLAITGLTAMMVSSSPQLMAALFGTPLMWVVMFAPLGVALFLQFRLAHLSAGTAQTMFWIYAGLMGVSLSSIFIMYTGTSIARVFFITAATFSGMSLYGYTTKRDLSSFGSFLFMGLIGVILASVVNIFVKSSMMQFIVSILSVIIFTGLTAYDTQRLKELYYSGDTYEVGIKKAILGALMLYLDFINLFLSLMRLIGDRRE